MAAVAYAAKGEGKKGSAGAQEPIITASGAYDSITNSVLVTKDMVQFAVEAGVSAVLTNIPPQYNELIMEKYDLAVDKVGTVQDEIDTLRLKNGIPPLSEMPGLLMKKIKPVLSMVEGSKPYGLCLQFLDAFEKHHPQHAGLIGKSLLDLALAFVVLGYFVFGYMLSLFCYFCCCGFCKRRAPAAQVELKKKPVSADKKRK